MTVPPCDSHHSASYHKEVLAALTRCSPRQHLQRPNAQNPEVTRQHLQSSAGRKRVQQTSLCGKLRRDLLELIFSTQILTFDKFSLWHFCWIKPSKCYCVVQISSKASLNPELKQSEAKETTRSKTKNPKRKEERNRKGTREKKEGKKERRKPS